MMYTELRKGQCVQVGDATIKLVETKGARARLSIEAPRTVKIEHERKKNQNATTTQDA